MVDIQSATAEIRRGKTEEKERRKKKKKKPQNENIMACLIPKWLTVHAYQEERRRNKTPAHKINVQSLMALVGEPQVVGRTPVWYLLIREARLTRPIIVTLWSYNSFCISHSTCFRLFVFFLTLIFYKVVCRRVWPVAAHCVEQPACFANNAV